MQSQNRSRSGAVVARWAHNPNVVRSSRASATNRKEIVKSNFLFLFQYISRCVARGAHIRQLTDVRSSRASATKKKGNCKKQFPFFNLTGMFTVYVLKSILFQKIYIGFTSDLDARIIAHNHPSNKGWTKSFKPWELIYTEEFQTKKEAMLREKQLKSAKGREFIHNKIH